MFTSHWGNGLIININKIQILQKRMIRNKNSFREHSEKLFKKKEILNI